MDRYGGEVVWLMSLIVDCIFFILMFRSFINLNFVIDNVF